MVLQMSRPWRNPATGVLYFRGRLPAHLSTTDDERVSVEVAGETSSVKLGAIIKISLRTKDASEARLRHASVQAQLQRRWSVAKKQPASLPRRQIMALAGIWYHELIMTHQDEPGDPDGWDVYQSGLHDGLAYFDPEGDGIEREPYNPKLGARILSQSFDIDEFLATRGLKLDEASRTALVAEVAYALVLGAETLKRRALGDYGPDRVGERFPPWQPDLSSIARPNPSGLKITGLFEGWAKESKPAQSTLDLWRSYLTSFIAFVGHDDVRAVQRADVVKWKQHLLELGNSQKTINDSKLAALKAILGWGVENDLLPTNAATKVSVRRGKKAGQKMLGFERNEAAVILQAAAKEASPVYRWVPLLCAQSGARVSEVCQLRAEDIGCDGGIWCMSFRAEAGALKNEKSERKVPLHPHVLDAGFLGFVRSRGAGPLFFNPSKRRPGAKKPQPKIVAKNVARWVHTLGIEVGLAFRKAPNHAWRHLFRTLARDIRMDESVVNSILGHAARSVGESYGETWLKTAARAVALMPLPGVTEGSVEGSMQNA